MRRCRRAGRAGQRALRSSARLRVRPRPEAGRRFAKRRNPPTAAAGCARRRCRTTCATIPYRPPVTRPCYTVAGGSPLESAALPRTTLARTRTMVSPTEYSLDVNPNIPHRLARLEELANNLWYSWDRATRSLFARLHPPLWDAVGHSPKAMLKRVDEQRLFEAADDPAYLSAFNRVLSAYDSYHSAPLRRNGSEWLRQADLVAYFCAEFGFHESFPIYSGGLGILAGDHCKAASDIRLPFVGVGLLYRQGYFSQTIDREGNQQPHYQDSDFDDLP